MNTTPVTLKSGASPSTHLELLHLLKQHPKYSQRQLAVVLGVSLGKAHYPLKALLGKGLVDAQNFQRSNHKLGYLYVLAPHGVRQRMQLTRSFLLRKEREREVLLDEIATLRKQLTFGSDTESSAEPK